MRRFVFALAAVAASLISLDLRAQDGALDTTFGLDGKTFLALDPAEGEQFRTMAMVTLPDGKLLVTGARNKIDPLHPFEPHERVIIARLHPNGSPDVSFGSDPNSPGIVVLPELAPLTRLSGGEAIQALPDGRMLIAGSLIAFGASYGFVVRTDEFGSIDGSFGDRGVTLVPSARFHALGLDSDGRPVVCGEKVGGEPLYRGLVVRLTADGLLDNSFALTGKVELVQTENGSVLDRNGSLTSLAVLDDHRIVVGGQAQIPDPALIDNYDFSIARLNGDGTFDTTFAQDGWLVLPAPGAPSDYDGVSRMVANIETGSLIFAGFYKPDDSHVQLALSRLDADGRVDSDYGSPSHPGFSLLSVDPAADYQYVTGMVAQSDGKLVLSMQASVGTNDNFVVARVLGDGRLDQGFASAGVANIDLAPAGVYDQTTGVALQGGQPVALGISRRSAASPIIEASLVRLSNSLMFTDQFED